MMFEKTFHLEIVTPTRILVQGEINSFVADGIDGKFEILANHDQFLTALRVGEIFFRKAKEDQLNWIATSGGFVEVKNNHVIVLAETAEWAHEIDVVRAEKAIQRAKERMKERQETLDEVRVRSALARALNRLHIARQYGGN